MIDLIQVLSQSTEHDIKKKKNNKKYLLLL